MKIGYARVSTRPGPDRPATRPCRPRRATDRVYVDHGITGTRRRRPGLREALAACRPGDTLVVTKLDRLARSVPDARDIVAELTARGVRLDLGGSVHDPADPADPIGQLLFTILSMARRRGVFSAGTMARLAGSPAPSGAPAWPSPGWPGIEGPTRAGSGRCRRTAEGPAGRGAARRESRDWR